ncbi:hypothetical protein [Nocardia sp. NBC_01329]|uniref:hypothetical protein n=1 Tax=Nocardia sp. NBC_01329 TaxID=2903594 RepID=UPI002E1217C2|nr:hypothetical protein OG405_27675 [Nocardia sp. NBC_01329]
MFERFTGRKKPLLTGEDYFNSDEYVRNQAIFDQFNVEIREARAATAANPGPDLNPETMAELQARADEMLTSEKRNWTYDADHWYDGEGNIIYSRGADGWYDTAGVRVYDLVYNRVTR